MECTLKYIPEYLHTNNKQIIETFTLGEKLFYRCKEGECEKPYDKISLFDISHNRNFADENTFSREDVLYNIIEDDIREKYEDLSIAELIISNIENEITFKKVITSRDDPKLKAEIILKHDPKPCMYPHSVFEISINNEVVNRDNYNAILNKRNVVYKNLRVDIRLELTSIIQTKKLDSSQDIEFIENP